LNLGERAIERLDLPGVPRELELGPAQPLVRTGKLLVSGGDDLEHRQVAIEQLPVRIGKKLLQAALALKGMVSAALDLGHGFQPTAARSRTAQESPRAGGGRIDTGTGVILTPRRMGRLPFPPQERVADAPVRRAEAPEARPLHGLQRLVCRPMLFAEKLELLLGRP
jgi:hypothetical protein